MWYTCLDQRLSLKQATRKNGHSSNGYGQFTACLPVSVGSPMRQLLSVIPRWRRAVPVGRHSRAGSKPTCYTRNRKNSFSSMRERVDAAHTCRVIRFGLQVTRFLLRKESSLSKRQIGELFPHDSFETAFWAWSIWGAKVAFPSINSYFFARFGF